LCWSAWRWPDGAFFYFATTNTLIQTSVSDEMRGRVMGIWALVFGGMMPVGGLESGLLAHAVSVPWAVATGATVCACAGLVTWWAVRRNPPGPVEPRQ
jgi:sugar phosphate permease